MDQQAWPMLKPTRTRREASNETRYLGQGPNRNWRSRSAKSRMTLTW